MAERPRFTRADLEAHRGRQVPDLVDLRRRHPLLVFVGINPGLWTAATGTHFAHPSNRFYPALHAAGITARRLDPSGALTPEDRRALIDQGIAITNLVARATARASELSAAELRSGARALIDRMARWRPAVVAVAGITAYRSAFGVRKVVMGRQPQGPDDRVWWVVPNPSGLNAHETVASLARWYRQAARDAGIELAAGPRRSR